MKYKGQLSSRFNEKLVFILFLGMACSFLISLFLVQLFTAGLVILWLIDKWSERKKIIDAVIIIFILFILLRLSSVIFSEYPKSSIQSLYKDALFYLSFFAFSFYFKVLSVERKKIATSIFIYGGAVASLLSIILFNIGIKDRAATFTSGYATLSSYLLCVLVFYLWNWEDKSSLISKSIWIMVGSLIISSLILAMSRTDIAIGILVLIAALVLRKVKILSFGIIIALAVIIIFGSLQNNKKEATNRVSNPTTLSDRDVIWGTAYQLIDRHPFFGFGTRTFGDVFPNRDKLADKDVGSWHNDYITIYLESGIISLTIFLIFIVLVFYKGIKKVREITKGNLQRIYLEMGMLSIAVTLLSAVTSGFVNNPILSILFSYTFAYYYSALTE